VRAESANRVREMLVETQKAGVTIIKPLYEDDSFVSFRCADPDAHAIEVYWEAWDPNSSVVMRRGAG
jgi:predicted lactoylglutathione lyase